MAGRGERAGRTCRIEHRELNAAAGVHLALWHGFTPVLALSLLTLALAACCIVRRDTVRRSIWPRSLGFERLYTGTLRVLDRVSAKSLHALQGASLRAYVLALIVTTGTLLAAVLLSNGPARMAGRWRCTTSRGRRRDDDHRRRSFGGACESTMTAVLSLGVSGYGMALTFLFFGAPDLAMTQFSVETLTAVIFVLVFYPFPRISASCHLQVCACATRSLQCCLEPHLRRAVLHRRIQYPAATGRLFRRSRAQPLAHGRNIVNVILVDFRALDTLGEITVLATAALGVRAVLRLGRGDKSS